MSSNQTHAIDPETVVAKVQEASKYRDVAVDLIRALAASESLKEKRVDDAVQRVKRKLHQVIGAYVDSSPPYQRWMKSLKEATDAEARLAVCRKILSGHASTRERVPEMSAIYEAIFSGIAPLTRIADLACGLNPIARPFMGIPQDTHYFASDVHGGLVKFISWFMDDLHYPGEARVADLLTEPGPAGSDVILLLKTLPCLEQIDADAGRRLLASLDAPYIVVTYPTATLGGRNVGMTSFYRDRFHAIVPAGRFAVEEIVFRSELVFRLRRLPPSPAA